MMSDFIKVNYMYGHVRIFKKDKIQLYGHDKFNVYLASPVFKAPKKEKEGYMENVQITQEEYNRLCKELGIV